MFSFIENPDASLVIKEAIKKANQSGAERNVEAFALQSLSELNVKSYEPETYHKAWGHPNEIDREKW